MSKMSNLWEHTNAEDLSVTRLSADRTVDLVVIGAGFTGCSAALEAARTGASTVVLEAETIAHGGSGRNVGLVNAGLWLPPDDVVAVVGLFEDADPDPAELGASLHQRLISQQHRLAQQPRAVEQL